jgi:hypothetical protein
VEIEIFERRNNSNSFLTPSQEGELFFLLLDRCGICKIMENLFS